MHDSSHPEATPASGPHSSDSDIDPVFGVCFTYPPAPAAVTETASKWGILVQLEQDLRPVEAFARAQHPRDDGELWKAYRTVKAMIRPLVGWDARHRSLRDSGFYHAALDYLLEIIEGNQR